MENAWKVNKSILDSVHGRIKVPVDLCKAVLDTAYFQRLRRIEQNSCRSVYPSARHDRFIHSLGVYHIGRIIADHINVTCEDILAGVDKKRIFETYLISCLLHDVGHTPFSHTFEEFYNRVKLTDELPRSLEKAIGKDPKAFKEDINNPADELTHHELISAWVALNVFPDSFKHLPYDIDWELLARMIIGLPYVDDRGNPRMDMFENIMIELIHGTIDADGLDYVCRDVWAGGYQNFTVDIHRLIESIKIIKEGDKYRLLFSSKGLNELETYLNVKNFQYFYVINHHKVILEQHYLIEGVKSAASYHTKKANREEAIKELCDFNSFIYPKILETSYMLYYPSDDDFVVLMKQTNPADTYINNWFSRNHSLSPLWKSKIEFFKIFSDLFKKSEELEMERIKIEEEKGARITEDQKKHRLKLALKRVAERLCDEECPKYIINKYSLDAESIYHKMIKPKIRGLHTKNIFIELNNDRIKFDELKYDSFSVVGVDLPFCYLYVDLDKVNKDNHSEAKMVIINDLIEYTNNIFI